jgi:hypothetical protein
MKQKPRDPNYTSAAGRSMSAWNTGKGGVMLDNETNEISVLIGDDCYYGTDDLAQALNDIGYKWGEE